MTPRKHIECKCSQKLHLQQVNPIFDFPKLLLEITISCKERFIPAQIPDLNCTLEDSSGYRGNVGNSFTTLESAFVTFHSSVVHFDLDFFLTSSAKEPVFALLCCLFVGVEFGFLSSVISRLFKILPAGYHLMPMDSCKGVQKGRRKLSFVLFVLPKSQHSSKQRTQSEAIRQKLHIGLDRKSQSGEILLW